jgi:ABC-type sugar transport system substrate-binding protein
MSNIKSKGEMQMKKKIASVLLAMTMVAALAGCGGGNSDSSAASSASSAKAASESTQAASEAKEEATEAASEAKEEAAAEATETAAASGDIAEMEECEDSYIREHYQDFCGTDSVEGKKVGFTLQTLGNDFMKYLSEGIKGAFEGAGCEISIDSCEGDSTRQIEIIENYITMGMDLIIAFPVNGDSLVAVAGQAEDNGVPVLAFAMDIPSDKITTHIISADENKMGAACGQMASDWADSNLADLDKVEVLYIGSTTSPEIAVRSDATEATLKENPRLNVTRVDTPDSTDTNSGRNTTENCFQGGVHYDMLVCCNSITAVGADSYLMSSDSPIEDVSKFAMFLVDETDEIDAVILASENNESTIRGTISMGDIGDTVDVLLSSSMPILTKGNPVTYIYGSAIPIDAETLKAKGQ